MRIKPMFRLCALCGLLLVAWVAAFADAQDSQNPQLGALLRNGAFVFFTTQTVPATTQELSFNSVEAEEKANLIHRVFVDQKNDFYFGYDLLVEPVAGTKQYQVSVRPLSPEFEKALRARKAFQTRRLHPSYNTAAFNGSARPQVVDGGDTFALDVLQNPRTGVKIVDLVKITSGDPRLQEAPASDGPPRDFTLTDVQLKISDYKLLVDGELVHRSTSACSGPLVWFALPERGRFIFSLVPRPGYDFQKVGMVEHNKISFTSDGVRYEWASSLPVVGTGGNWNLWVLHDKIYSFDLFDQTVRGLGGKEGDGGGESTLERKTREIQQQRRRAGFGAPPAAQSDKSETRRRHVRVIIGAADGTENLLPPR